jgi:adenylyltransferase/sulfurtransferase
VPSCAEAGVLGVLPGVIGTIQATEAIKMILGIGAPLVGRLLLYDASRMRFRAITLPKDPDCPICGPRPSITELREVGARCATATPGSASGRTGVGPESGPPAMTVSELKSRIDGGTAPLILDVREPWEAAVCRLPGARLIPLGELPGRLAELDPAAEIVVQCKSGRRSAQAVALLHDRGFARAVNLTGGILSWINEIDPSLPRY